MDNKILGYDNIGELVARKFRRLTKGVIELGNTTKKTVIKHKRDGLYTACGRYIADSATTIKTNKTWRGVTCKRCLAVRAKATRTSTKKTTKTTRKASVDHRTGVTVL